MEQWKSKIAIVTGPSINIGAAITKKLVKNEITVVGFSLNIERAEQLAEKLRGEKGKFIPLKVNITTEIEVIEAFKWITNNLSPVQILINNARISFNESLIDGSFQHWKETLDTNILGLCLTTTKAIKQMEHFGVKGHIINIGSIVAHSVTSEPNLNLYPATKVALTSLARTLRAEIRDKKLNIKVSNVSPGFVDTVRDLSSRNYLCQDKPLKLLKTDDIADAIEYLLGTSERCEIREIIMRPYGEYF